METEITDWKVANRNFVETNAKRSTKPAIHDVCWCPWISKNSYSPPHCSKTAEGRWV